MLLHLNKNFKLISTKKTKSNNRLRFFCFILLTTQLSLNISCSSLLTTRPYFVISETEAAIRAAKEVQADILAPELFRQAQEWFFSAKRNYKFKYFKLAKAECLKAKVFAEKAEFEALKNGAERTSIEAPPDQYSQDSGPSEPTPFEEETPEPILYEEYEEQLKKNKKSKKNKKPNPNG